MIFIKYVFIDAYGGGSENGIVSDDIVEKNFSLEISNYLYNRLNELGVDVYLTREIDEYLSVQDRIDIINNIVSNNDVILLSNRLNENSGIEIIYALRNNSNLSSSIASYLVSNGFTVNDYYQKRDSSDTTLDEDELIRNTDYETLIIRYGIDNVNDIEGLSEAVIEGIISYLGGTYTNENYTYYTVKSGDNLYSIASLYNTTVDEIKELNNLDSNNLSIGQILKIPSDSNNSDNDSSNTQYVVTSGDNLYGIARRYNTTVAEIKRINNLNSDNLSIGEILILPNTSNTIDYIVESGDNLYRIASLYKTTVDEIKELNNLDSNNLSIGQVLKIPI